MKKFRFSIVLALAALLALTFTSCEKDNETTPDYVGSWVDQEEENMMGMPITLTYTVTLTESSFEMAVSVDLGQGIVMPGGGMKGGMSVSGNQMTITPTSVGAPNEDNVVVWVNKGDAGWQDALDEIEMDDPQTGTYKVVGNELTVTLDGDDESQTFTRK